MAAKPARVAGAHGEYVPGTLGTHAGEGDRQGKTERKYQLCRWQRLAEGVWQKLESRFWLWNEVEGERKAGNYTETAQGIAPVELPEMRLHKHSTLCMQRLLLAKGPSKRKRCQGLFQEKLVKSVTKPPVAQKPATKHNGLPIETANMFGAIAAQEGEYLEEDEELKPLRIIKRQSMRRNRCGNGETHGEKDSSSYKTAAAQCQTWHEIRKQRSMLIGRSTRRTSTQNERVPKLALQGGSRRSLRATPTWAKQWR